MKRVEIVDKKIVGPVLLLLSAIGYFAAGVFCLVNIEGSATLLCKLICVFAITIGVLMLTSFIFIRKKRMVSTLASGGLYLLLGLFVLFFPYGFVQVLTYVIGIYIFINFAWRLIFSIQLKVNKDNGFVGALFSCIVSLVFCIFLFVYPFNGVKIVYIIFGVYLLFYGFNMFGDFIREILKWDLQGKHIKRRIKIRIPVLFTTFLPMSIMNRINNSLKAEDEGTAVTFTKGEDSEIKTSLDIFIHMAPQIAGGLGHVDICFEGTVYSYGTYDSDSVRGMGTISDGVFVEMPRDEYIKHCLSVDNENIVDFSIYLTEEQIEKMRSYIAEFKKGMYEWKCKKQVNPSGDYTDPASVFYSKFGAKFYKFTTGKFKTYFAVRTNCVQMADTLVGGSGIDIISLNGIITPGTYYSYLDDRFKRQNSFVVKKTILTGAKD